MHLSHVVAVVRYRLSFGDDINTSGFVQMASMRPDTLRVRHDEDGIHEIANNSRS